MSFRSVITGAEASASKAAVLYEASLCTIPRAASDSNVALLPQLVRTASSVIV
jgi:hypothetical protein